MRRRKLSWYSLPPLLQTLVLIDEVLVHKEDRATTGQPPNTLKA